MRALLEQMTELSPEERDWALGTAYYLFNEATREYFEDPVSFHEHSFKVVSGALAAALVLARDWAIEGEKERPK